MKEKLDGGWGMGEVIFKKPMVEMFFKMIREGTEKRKRGSELALTRPVGFAVGVVAG